MDITRYRIRPNLYRDSIALMRLAAGLLARPGVRNATAMMATPANCEALGASGMALPAETHFSPDDLLLLVVAGTAPDADAALDWGEAELASRPAAGEGARPRLTRRTLGQALQSTPGANLALISVPGEYAYGQALQALKAGLHVFLFSSGVTLEDEARLKRLAVERDLLMMGAECGTAILDGVPLGFANAVRRGNIGIVGASGTGIQQVTSLIHNAGGGISQAIGTGGRDLSITVNALTTLAGLRLLAADPETHVIVLISKAPAPSVAERVLQAARQTHKPTVVAFMGADPGQFDSAGLSWATTLEQAARLALTASGLVPPEPIFGWRPPKSDRPQAPGGARRFVRGLYSGGTLCSEAGMILRAGLGSIARPTASDPFPAAHTCLDLGEEEFTVGRPHPMIDGRLRAEKMLQAGRDPQTAVVLFDVVLGYGASPDPCALLIESIRQAAPECIFVAHVCGTDEDPQGLGRQVGRLREAGVITAPTNAAAARLALELVTP